MKEWHCDESEPDPDGFVGERMCCGVCGSEDIYYDTNPHNLPPLTNGDGTPYRCLMGVIQTGEPGAERCRACGSLDVELLGCITEGKEP